jgi:hypothetical protein
MDPDEIQHQDELNTPWVQAWRRASGMVERQRKTLKNLLVVILLPLIVELFTFGWLLIWLDGLLDSRAKAKRRASEELAKAFRARAEAPMIKEETS